MATMWPRQLPMRIRSNPIRSAECKVYDKLAAALDDGWTVFYSRPWLGLSGTGEEIEGEADFVVAHPAAGMLALEIKGGEIRHDPEKDAWTSTDRHGIKHPIKNPFAQASSAKHRIIEKLRESPHWSPRFVPAGHGVVFPDTIVPDRSFGPDKPRAIIADRAQTSAGFGEWLAARMAATIEGGREPLGGDGIRALTKLLAEPIHFRIPLGNLLDDDDDALALLTENQFRVLQMVSSIKRVAICGGAGTGKTVLATEIVRREARAGRRVLFTCFNRTLATHVAYSLKGIATARNFHALCGWVASEAGLAIPSGIPEKQLHDNVLPELLVDAAAVLPNHKFDVIVADEGQDFLSHWWAALDELLRPDGRLVVFHDSNQRVYGDAAALPQDIYATPILLNLNLRNTDSIHRAAMVHYDGEPILSNGIPGVPVDFRRIARDAVIGKEIEALVRRLIRVERIDSGDIAILFVNENELNRQFPGRRMGTISGIEAGISQSGRIVMDTIRRFKGLEAKVVIVAVNKSLLENSELSYVAFTRPRTMLYVIGEQVILDQLQPPINMR